MVRLLVVLLACVLAVPVAAGQLVDDPEGDVTLDAAGESAGGAPDGRYQHLDLVGLMVEETRETVRFTLDLLEFEDAGVLLVDDGVYAIHFVHNDQPFRLILFLFATPDGLQGYARLDRQSAEDEGYDPVDYPLLEVDVAGAKLSAEVYRDDLRDRSGADPFPGRALEGFHVSARSQDEGPFLSVNGMEQSWPASGIDRMPDEGLSVARFEFQEGLRQTGHAELWTDRPMRASNGEASTFVFTVTARNTGDAPDDFELAASSVPAGWHVSLPEQVVQLAAGEQRDLPVILSTPFSHRHGASEEFLMTMTSRTDPESVGRARLGIYFHDVPQPAGHHDEVWFHSGKYYEGVFADVTEAVFAPGPFYTYFNTLEEDPNDLGLGVPGWWRGIIGESGVPQSRWIWSSYISPGLAMGLDFDLTRTGTIRFPVTSELPLVQATVSGELFHWSYDEERGEYQTTTIATYASPPQDILPGTTNVHEWTFTPAAEADLLPFSDRQGLVFLFQLDSPTPHMFTGVEAPRMAPGGGATLPLLEYRDPVQDQYAAHTQLHFTVPAAERVNPGSTRIVEGSLHNAGKSFDYRISLDGVNAEWARLLVPSTGTLAADGTLLIRVAVAAPDSAIDGDAADIVVSVVDRNDPTLRALGRFFVAVDESETLPDDADTMGDAVGSENAPLGLLVPAALGAALALRRRR